MTTVRVQWLKNHGVRIITESDRGRSERFEPNTGSVTVVEAAAALGSYPVKMYRLIASKSVKARKLAGSHRVPVRELWRLRRDRTPLEDGRKRRETAA